MTDSVFIALLVYMFLCAVMAAASAPKGRGFEFFILTLVLLGPLGVVAALIVNALESRTGRAEAKPQSQAPPENRVPGHRRINDWLSGR
jgi:hypothetical protein